MSDLVWKDFLIWLLEFTKAFGIPIAVILVIVILKPVISTFLERATKITFFPPSGLDIEGQPPQFSAAEAQKFLSEPKEEIEKLRLYLETEQIKQLITYHQNGLYQSRVSFWFSIGSASLGFLIILLGVLYIFVGAQTTTSYISIASGTVVDAVAALFFTQSNQARRLMTEFFDKLRVDRQFNESLRLCAAIDDSKMRGELQVRLSLFFAGVRDGIPQTEPAAAAPPRRSSKTSRPTPALKEVS